MRKPISLPILKNYCDLPDAGKFNEHRKCVCVCVLCIEWSETRGKELSAIRVCVQVYMHTSGQQKWSYDFRNVENGESILG